MGDLKEYRWAVTWADGWVACSVGSVVANSVVWMDALWGGLLAAVLAMVAVVYSDNQMVQ